VPEPPSEFADEADDDDMMEVCFLSVYIGAVRCGVEMCGLIECMMLCCVGGQTNNLVVRSGMYE